MILSRHDFASRSLLFASLTFSSLAGNSSRYSSSLPSPTRNQPRVLCCLSGFSLSCVASSMIFL